MLSLVVGDTGNESFYVKFKYQEVETSYWKDGEMHVFQNSKQHKAAYIKADKKLNQMKERRMILGYNIVSIVYE